jgi:hypothetical protein
VLIVELLNLDIDKLLLDGLALSVEELTQVLHLVSFDVVFKVDGQQGQFNDHLFLIEIHSQF